MNGSKGHRGAERGKVGRREGGREGGKEGRTTSRRSPACVVQLLWRRSRRGCSH